MQRKLNELAKRTDFGTKLPELKSQLCLSIVTGPYVSYCSMLLLSFSFVMRKWGNDNIITYLIGLL
jgi:hypothetical protein